MRVRIGASDCKVVILRFWIDRAAFYSYLMGPPAAVGRCFKEEKISKSEEEFSLFKGFSQINGACAGLQVR